MHILKEMLSVLDCEDVCPACGNDYFYNKTNTYVGAHIKNEKEPICKRCEAQGLEAGTLLLNEDEATLPEHLVFVAVARPHVTMKKEDQARIVTSSFEEVRALPPHSYDFAMVEDLIAQRNGPVWQALKRGGPGDNDFLNAAFLRSIWEEANVNSIRLYALNNKKTVEIAHLYLHDYCSGEFDDFEQAICEAAWNYDTVFIGTDDDAALCEEACVVPHTLHRTIYFNPDRALRWYGSVEEVEQQWRRLDMLRPEQYELERVYKRKKYL